MPTQAGMGFCTTFRSHRGWFELNSFFLTFQFQKLGNIVIMPQNCWNAKTCTTQMDSPQTKPPTWWESCEDRPFLMSEFYGKSKCCNKGCKQGIQTRSQPAGWAGAWLAALSSKGSLPAPKTDFVLKVPESQGFACYLRSRLHFQVCGMK